MEPKSEPNTIGWIHVALNGADRDFDGTIRIPLIPLSHPLGFPTNNPVRPIKRYYVSVKPKGREKVVFLSCVPDPPDVLGRGSGIPNGDDVDCSIGASDSQAFPRTVGRVPPAISQNRGNSSGGNYSPECFRAAMHLVGLASDSEAHLHGPPTRPIALDSRISDRKVSTGGLDAALRAATYNHYNASGGHYN